MENCLSLWRCFTLVALCGGNELTPVKVLYSKPYTMTVVLELMNVPIEVTGYVINEKKRNKSYNEVKSGDNLPAEYYKAGEKRELILPFKVILEKSNSHTIYEVFLKANGVYCNRALNREFLQIVYTEKEQSVDILSKITLDWKNECLNTAPKETDKRDSGTLTDKVREDQREPEQPAENSTRARQLMIGGACVVGALVLLLAGLWASWCWRRQNSQEEEEGDYITYAELALPETDSKPPNKPEKKDYVEIVGVYKNKTQNK